jgi:FkbM family methyltransferase
MIARAIARIAGVLNRIGLGALARAPAPRWLGRQLRTTSSTQPKVSTVVSGLGRGLKLVVLPETPLSHWLGTHEPETQRVLRERLRPGMVVYDCGANVGYFSAMCARLVGPTGRVFAFEPSPRSFECLSALGRLNGFEHVEAIPQAVWTHGGTLRFKRGTGGRSFVSDHVEGSLPETSEPAETVEISAVSIDEFVLDQHHPAPDFLKVDVEGSEAAALAGAKQVIVRHRPTILVEIHGAAGTDLWSLFHELGYQPRDIATGRVPSTVDEFAVWLRSYLVTPA